MILKPIRQRIYFMYMLIDQSVNCLIRIKLNFYVIFSLIFEDVPFDFHIKHPKKKKRRGKCLPAGKYIDM